jgi:predicted DNA-binding transcriptional regulator AlpA
MILSIDKLGNFNQKKMSAITIESEAFKIIMNKLNLIEQFIKEAKTPARKWINEEEVVYITGLSKSSLRKKRSRGVFTYSTATGRKIKYLKKEVEDYLDNNSTQ